MKPIIPALSLLIAFSSIAFAETDAESQFLARLSEVIRTKSAARLSEVFPSTSSLEPGNIVITQQLKVLMLRGDVEYQIVDDEIVRELKARGGLTGTPIKLVVCRPKQEIEGFEDATSFVVGESDGRLVILGNK